MGFSLVWANDRFTRPTSPAGPSGECGSPRPVPPRRFEWHPELAKCGDISVIESAPRVDRLDATGYLIGIGAWSDRTVTALKPYANNPRKLFAAAVISPEYLTS